MPKDIKEHVAAQIMANTAAGAALACFVFASDDLFYNITVNVSLLLSRPTVDHLINFWILAGQCYLYIVCVTDDRIRICWDVP